ncbi:MAG: PAS domain-containing sensor histidine kinase [Candidatus Gracilibacteria bacterium]|nr:PAS domain-containing sensor histidine kinase [Candidatus Gracilibacteria bacterium]MDD2908709.1 PAS domain-containing sensor histidine kinase [Candidatus Gracilibacteria bacterium]
MLDKKEKLHLDSGLAGINHVNVDFSNLADKYTSQLLEIPNIQIDNVKEIVKNLIVDTLKLSSNSTNEYCSRIEEIYSDLFLQINTGIGFTSLDINNPDKKKIIIRANPQLCKMLGVTRDEIEGQDKDEFFNQFIVDKNLFEEGKKLFKEKKVVDSFMLPFNTKKGENKWFIVSSKFIPNLSLEYFTITDATSIKELEQVNDYILKVLTHDIRNPLSAVIGYLDLIKENENSPDKINNYLDNCMLGAKRIEELVNDQLQIMKIEAGTYRLKLWPIDLYDFIKAIQDRFNMGIKDNKYSLKISDDTIIKPYVIQGDIKWLENLFENVLKNSLDATISSKSNFATTKIEDFDSHILLSFHNEGCIPSKLAPKLFKQRYVNTTKKNGNGIGTYFASIIAKIHGGDIWIKESTIENGTTICVKLPKKFKEINLT